MDKIKEFALMASMLTFGAGASHPRHCVCTACYGESTFQDRVRQGTKDSKIVPTESRRAKRRRRNR